MKGIIEKNDEGWVIVYNKRKRETLAPYSYIKIKGVAVVDPKQHNLCVEGKQVNFLVRRIHGVNYGIIDELKLYSKIENAIIVWNENGIKTAGDLTKEILSIIKKNNSMFILKHQALTALKNVRDQYDDEDCVGSLTDKHLKNILNEM